MLAGQKLKSYQGNEVALFPLEYLYMTQDSGGDYSHAGTYNIDFSGWGASGRVKLCPYYAPCKMKVVNTQWDPNSHNIVWESTEKVLLANNQVDYLTIAFAHDNNLLYKVGDVVEQGTLIGHTGTTGHVTGDHVHICCGQGHYRGMTKRSTGNWDLTNRIEMWDALWVNDTVIVRGYDHKWRVYQGSIVPEPPIPEAKKLKSKFPWVLYARKFRSRN